MMRCPPTMVILVLVCGTLPFATSPCAAAVALAGQPSARHGVAYDSSVSVLSNATGSPSPSPSANSTTGVCVNVTRNTTDDSGAVNGTEQVQECTPAEEEAVVTAPLMCETDVESLTKFKGVPLCIKVRTGSTEDPTWTKAVFHPNLDEFSQITVPDTQPSATNPVANNSRTGNDALVFLESMGVNSLGRRWTNDDASVVVNEMYAIVEVYDGRVFRIAWDENPCATGICADSPQLCVEDQCGVAVAETCAEDPAPCQLRVHLTYVGTDSAGDPLKTANIRKSNWAQYSFAAAGEGLLKAAQAAKDFKDEQTGGDGGDGGNGGGGNTATPTPAGNATDANNTNVNGTDGNSTRRAGHADPAARRRAFGRTARGKQGETSRPASESLWSSLWAWFNGQRD